MVSRAEKDLIKHGVQQHEYITNTFQSPLYEQIHFHQITLKMAADDMTAKL